MRKGRFAIVLAMMAGISAGVGARTVRAAGHESAGRSRSVLLILTDDQGFHMSCAGTPGIATPAMDGLARAGVCFERAYATCASCSPSRSALLTGMYPHFNGHWRNTAGPLLSDPDDAFGRASKKVDAVGVHEDLPTLIELLNGRGFVTGITQKFHLSPPWKYPFTIRKPCGHLPEQHGRAVTSFLKACSDRPFFLMANVGNTHRPFRKHLFPVPAGKVDPRRIAVPANLPDTPLMREDLADYFDSVQCADACVGRILDALRKSGRADDTLVIFTSDQGYAYHRAKATVYDAGVRVPLIVTGPGVRAGVWTRELASHVDLVPTLLEYLGIEVPEAVQGRSLWGVLRGDADARGDILVFSEHNSHGPVKAEWYPVRSVTDGRFRYLRNLMPEKTYQPPADLLEPEPWGNRAHQATLDAKQAFPQQYELLARTWRRPPEELYDLHSDPAEMHDLAGDVRYAKILTGMRRAVDVWMAETEDPGDPLRIKRRD